MRGRYNIIYSGGMIHAAIGTERPTLFKMQYSSAWWLYGKLAHKPDRFFRFSFVCSRPHTKEKKRSGLAVRD